MVEVGVLVGREEVVVMRAHWVGKYGTIINRPLSIIGGYLFLLIW